MSRTRILYARYETGADALGVVECRGMAIYDSSKCFIGYIPNEHWRVDKERYLYMRGFQGKAFVKLMPKLKTR